MSFKLDKKYLMYIFYICLTAILIFISYNIVFNINTILASIINLISSIFGLFAPVMVGAVIAYLLYPITIFISGFLAKRFKFKRKPYLLSVILTYIFVLLFFILLIYGTYALIGGQMTGKSNISTMMASIKEYIARYNELFKFINNKIIESGLSSDAKGYLNQAIAQISKVITLSVDNFFQFSKGFGSTILNGSLGLVISFYFLKDYEFFKRMYKKIMLLFFKKEKFHSINNTIQEINQVVSKFIRGQFLDALIVGLLSSIGLAFIGLDFAFIIGFTAGIANIIPYVGPVVGCIPAIIVGAFSPNPMVAVWAVLVFFIVQQLDGAVISPKIVGDSTGLHPVFVIMAIIIGGSFGGILGMLLSVPIMGIIKLFFSKYIEKKQIESCEENISEKEE